MSARERFRRILAGESGGEILVDIGTSTVTGVRATGAPLLADRVGSVGHQVLQTVALSAADSKRAGSDFARVGPLFPPPQVVDEQFVDGFGVTWLWADGEPAPVEHPLEHADIFGIARHPRPRWPSSVQLADDAEDQIIVADAPSSGLLETSFSLRNSWQLLCDLTDNWRAASALLDWAAETAAEGYESYLAALPEQPDMLIYGDDFGYQANMFLSDEDFRTFVRPRLRTVISRIRRATSAAICFHSCGAIRPILPDLADLGVELLNLQYDARGIVVDEVRRVVGDRIVLHGFTDLVALGRAIERGDDRGVAVLASELAASGAVVAAPVDSMSGLDELLLASRAAVFVRAIDPDDWELLRTVGPVAPVLRAAREQALDAAVPDLTGEPPAVTVRPEHAARAGG
ncbi:hypothetical protein Acsp06_64140 [Actinomycetospora sp. NBRC 106375]|uniref:uroporphyrinogen decarboxylase family protein n=1 Tax=Actinomycetospora sp. NBRC 106375 TaxID=3032207 RepID=UPI0024A35FD4|nr:uroporphyrinogen decarboxylase family protein [Actinomycetospora sp. NBRC 106375]GLZ50229.1 hypothetical protein Acsp06_64140 [Actinomycetospora sp. NBRC 106375]